MGIHAVIDWSRLVVCMNSRYMSHLVNFTVNTKHQTQLIKIIISIYIPNSTKILYQRWLFQFLVLPLSYMGQPSPIPFWSLFGTEVKCR